MNLFIIEKMRTIVISITSIAKSCVTPKKLLQKIPLPLMELSKIEKETRGQSKNPKWHEAREGRITASNFYRVHTKIQSLEKKAKDETRALLKSLIDPPALGHLPQIQHGLNNEEIAVTHLVGLLRDQRHRDVSVNPCGLYIYRDLQYLGASPDGIVCCSCCSPRLLEVKCPTRPVAALTYLDRNRKLKKKTNYYSQIQGQMLIANMQECYFFVYYNEDSWNLELIAYDEPFCRSLKANLKTFYHCFMAPQLLEKKL